MYLTSILLVIILARLMCIAYRNYTQLNKIPRLPYGLLFKHGLGFRDPTKSLKIFTDYCVEHGGLLRSYLPPFKPSIVVCDPELLQVLLNSDKMLAKSTHYRNAIPWLGTGLLTSEVEKWKSRRRMLVPSFGRPSLLKHFIGVFDSLGDVLINKLNKEIDNHDLDVFPLVKMYSLDVICETVMGVSEVNTQGNISGNYMTSIEEICQTIFSRAISLVKRFDCIHRFTSDYKIQCKAIEIVDQFFYNVIKNRKKKNEQYDNALKPTTFLDLMLKFHEENEKFTISDIREEVNTIMFGGHDTTATGIAFTLYALARHSEIQDKVIEEQLNIFGTLNEVTPSLADLMNMKYLESVIYEALRLFPPIPIIGRRTTAEMSLGNGIMLPKDLNVVIFIYGWHHHPKYFADPEKFIPERFVNNEISPFRCMPFSLGPRNCIGQKFAILEMKTCLSKIIRNFRLQPSSPAEYELQLCPRVILASNNGIRLSLRKRICE